MTTACRAVYLWYFLPLQASAAVRSSGSDSSSGSTGMRSPKTARYDMTEPPKKRIGALPKNWPVHDWLSISSTCAGVRCLTAVRTIVSAAASRLLTATMCIEPSPLNKGLLGECWPCVPSRSRGVILKSSMARLTLRSLLATRRLWTSLAPTPSSAFATTCGCCAVRPRMIHSSSGFPWASDIVYTLLWPAGKWPSTLSHWSENCPFSLHETITLVPINSPSSSTQHCAVTSTSLVSESEAKQRAR
eukprot:scaffold108068_cov63-Phaeocystis_antarctica.AAC.6